MRISPSLALTEKFSGQELMSFFTYEHELNDYQSLSTATFLKCNNTQITQGMGLKVLYAMELGKPIILSTSPTFAKNVLPFVREEIMRRLNKIYIANIEVLDNEDAEMLLHSVLNSPINYLVTRHQQAILRSYIRLHLRQLPTTA